MPAGGRGHGTPCLGVVSVLDSTGAAQTADSTRPWLKRLPAGRGAFVKEGHWFRAIALDAERTVERSLTQCANASVNQHGAFGQNPQKAMAKRNGKAAVTMASEAQLWVADSKISAMLSIVTCRVFTAIALAAMLGLSGCGSAGASQPAKPPPRLQKSRSQATPKQQREQPPQLVAPPPAYGNKVVMARGVGTSTVQ